MTPETLLAYIDKNQGTPLPFAEELAAPLHTESILDRNRELRRDEVGFAAGYRLLLNVRETSSLQTAICDFRSFMKNCLEVPDLPNSGYTFSVAMNDEVAAATAESFSLDIGQSGCRISASDINGIRRALIYLEDEMSIRRFPALPLKTVARSPSVKLRISRSPLASYRFGTGWELDKQNDAYPEEYLNKMAHCGINAIWVAGILRELVHSKVLPEMTVPETRLELLAKLVKKAEYYGIKVYFFCIEPRIQDERDPVFQAHPEIRGSKWGNYGRTICTSHPLVLEYIQEVTAELFRKAPGLGGMINLFRGERTTACCSPPPPLVGSDPKDPTKGRPADYVKPCPGCAKLAMEDIYCAELASFLTGMRSVSDDTRLIAWNYGHNQMDLNKKILAKIHPDIIFLDTFEHDGKKQICGKTRTIDEYAISYVGPSDPFRELNNQARKYDKSLFAKIQLGATYETPSMPYVPVPTSAYRKFKWMAKHNINGVMQSWIIGGFPSVMHKAAGEAAFAPLEKDETAFLRRLAAIEWGEKQADTVCQAWKIFFKAYDLYPFSSPIFYFGPIAKSPAYHLYLEPQGDIAKPYNWGLTRDRNPQPYEDNLQRWLGSFTVEEIITSFRNLAGIWQKGLTLLQKAAAYFPVRSPQARELAVATALQLQFCSAANVFEFYQLRETLGTESKKKERTDLYQQLRRIAKDDIRLAQAMKPLLQIEPSIGYQAEMQCYSFSIPLLDAKIEQVNKMLAKLGKD